MENKNCNLWKAVEKSPISGILIMYTFVVGWFVGGLTAFHLYLISTNQTTYENFRYQYDLKTNPYNIGFAGNFKEIFWSKIPSSRNNFRMEAKGDIIAGFSVSSHMSRTISPEMRKGRFDVEMGKRKGVDANELEDIRFGGLERSRTEPRHAEWDKRINS
ncbi:hypothetical protein BUALT_Bualt17G0006500 [Buddleja alternifolia]|uniref:Protein S-acyltransferase n=1 Tax=Buddleja alternifolia TaxID=168488 RepID=A0AAV6W3H2_9LAMI|nr:hypothetical protein BUALT_Bualt17G0006500 [Buddleja alternifolia]